MFESIIVLVVLFVVIGFIYNLYVQLIQKKNKVEEAISSVDVQLKKRYDLIPNILQLTSKFMEHEKGIFEEVTKLRTQAMKLSNNPNNFEKKMELNNKINDLMGKLMVSVENYPDLKSNQSVVTAMQTYNEVEEHIAASRRFYNSAVLELNNAVEIFPSSIFASLLNIKKHVFFETDETSKKSVNVSDYIK